MQGSKRAEAGTVVIEIGASSCQARIKIDGIWLGLFRFGSGEKASSVGGADAMPTITVIKNGDPGVHMSDCARVRHGHDALRALKMHPSDWVPFEYLKYVFMREGVLPDIKATHALQEKNAEKLGTSLRDIALAFFQHLVGKVVGTGKEIEKVVLNITDSWHNSDAQELLQCFRKSHPGIDFRGYNECELCLIAKMSEGETPKVVVDCGHSTMVCREMSL
jgi:hypothetical protein